MSTIHISREHHMAMDKLRSKIDQLAVKLGDKLSAEYQWQGDELTFKRTGASGCIRIDTESVDVTMELAMLLRPLRGTVEDAVNEYLDENIT